MNKHWQSKYFEKSAKESHVNIFRSLEIENYLKQLLKKKGFNLHLYRLNFSNSVLHIFVSSYKKALSNKKSSNLKTKKTELLNKIVSKNILKTLTHFTRNKFHINFKLLNLNNHNQQTKPKTILNLSRFRIPEIELLYPLVIKQKDSAKLLGTFIAEYLKTTKRHNFFLNSLSKSLHLALKQQDSKIKGVKILLKGRLNNAARSRNKYLKIGTIPLITKSRDIDYAESTAFTQNGTIGIKVWISYKKIQNVSKEKGNPVKTRTSDLRLKNF
jgi:ribosomal protein S3